MAYLHRVFADRFLFLEAQSNWGRSAGSSAAFATLGRDLATMASIPTLLTNLTRYVGAWNEAFLTIAALVLGVIVFIRLRKSYGVYVLASLAVPLVSGSTTSLNRLVVPLFPVFILLAIFGRNRTPDWVITFLFALLLGLFASMYVTGYWVA
jgi:hypothetical protein